MDYILRQIEVTLVQEEKYVEEFNRQLKSDKLDEAKRSKIIIYQQSCINAIDRLLRQKKRLATI